MRCSLRLLAPALLFLVSSFCAQAQETPDTSQSPYFFVKGSDPNLDALPLKSTTAKVEITGVMADVKVTQVYANTGTRPLEALYVFPGSTRAAVYAMTMRIGERVLKAVIQEKAKARQIYETAKQEGRSASLLEQERPNVFQMNVANILPGDEIHVELRYTELLVPRDGEYQFVYPTVVGPRYGGVPGTASATGEKWVVSPYTKAGEAPFASFGLELRLLAGMPIQAISCSSHKTQINYDSPQLALVNLEPSETQGGNRDFILKYRLRGGQIQSGLLLSKGEKEGDENFFLLMVQPPKRVTPEFIPPREYVFIMDVSGSQHGFPLDISKRLMSDLVSNLRPQDRFNVMVFASGYAVWSKKESKPATKANIESALAFVSAPNGGGGTEMLAALKHAMELPAKEGISRTFVVTTDGYISADYQVLDYLHAHLGDANMFAFGIGTSVNRFLIEGMAHAGMGEAFVVTNPAAAPSVATKFREYIASPVLTNIKLTFQDFKVYDVEPLRVPDVLSERPILCFGKWKGEAKGAISVDGFSGSGNYHHGFAVETGDLQASGAALRNSWARNRIQLLGDYGHLGGSNKQQEITALGLKYGLLTDYTSFVAVDTLVRNPSVENVSVQQPLPMPQGVSNLAVGGITSTASSANSGAQITRALPSSSAAASVNLLNGGTAFRQRTDRAAQLGIQVVLDSVEGDSSLIPVSDLRTAVEQALGELHSMKNVKLETQYQLELEFDGSGSILRINLSPSCKALQESLESLLNAWKIPGAEGRGPFKVRFLLKVRS